MGNIEHWDAGICPSCGTLYAEIFTLCECELPHNTEGVEVERVRLVRDSRLRGAIVPDDAAVERLALTLAREPGWNGAEHDANEAAQRLLAALRGQ